MKRRAFLAVFTVLFVGILISGCIEMYTTMNIDTDGFADITFIVSGDKSMIGTEMDLFFWALTNSIPELTTDYVAEKNTETNNYSSNVTYSFKRIGKYNVNENDSISFINENGRYQFVMNIPPLVQKVDENTKDRTVYVITVTLPKEIDMANSREINGNQVTWKISYGDLVKGTTLKAFTVE